MDTVGFEPTTSRKHDQCEACALPLCQEPIQSDVPALTHGQVVKYAAYR